MDTAIIVLIAAVIGGGTLGAVLRAWNLSTRVHGLEVAVEKLQGQVTSTVKSMAAKERWGTKPRAVTEAEELLAAAGKATAPKTAAPPMMWWGKNG